MIRDLRGVLGRRLRSARGVSRRPRAEDARAARRAAERDGARARRAPREAPARRARLLPGPRRRTRATPSRARRCAGSAGVVSFVVKGGLEAASRVVDAMKLARIGPSFGGVEALIEQPAVMSYYEMTTEQRAAIGIADGLVRLAVGIEDAADLVADIEQRAALTPPSLGASRASASRPSIARIASTFAARSLRVASSAPRPYVLPPRGAPPGRRAGSGSACAARPCRGGRASRARDRTSCSRARVTPT